MVCCGVATLKNSVPVEGLDSMAACDAKINLLIFVELL